MNLKNVPALRWYFHIFAYVAQVRLKKNDIDPREIHTQIVVVISTGVLMWAYAILACLSISSPVAAIIGCICATVHTFSPMIFRFTNNSYISSNVLLTAGIVHQGTFSYYSGGFDSNILIWFGILPMIGGVISGRKGAVTWLYCSLVVSLAFFVLQLSGHEFPYLISKSGRLWSQALLVFGWICLSSTIVIVYAGLREHTEKLLNTQSKKIDDLFRVLFHDLANPLGRIAIGISIAKKQLPDAENNRGLEIASLASDSMMEITQNIRRMYAVSKGKGNVDLTLTPLNSAVAYILKLHSSDLERKQIKLAYHFAKNEGLNLLVEPISFNNQVLGNILSNAIKFSPPGSEINLTAYPLTHNSFAIEVKDNGIGMPQVLINQLFDLNKKTTRPGTNGESGTGFGMHIMKSFVEMYGGELIVESKEAKDETTPSGSTIKLILKGEWN
jgi:signal transduction histidine kinase